MLSPTQAASPRLGAPAFHRWWEAWIFRISGLKKNQRALKAASYVLPLFVCSMSLLCLIGVLRVYDPVNTKNLKHQSNLSTFMGLVTGPRPFTHLGSLLQQLRYGLREPRGDIASYKAQLRTEIYYLHKELALLERDLRIADFKDVKQLAHVDRGVMNATDVSAEEVTVYSWIERENLPVQAEVSEIAIPFYLYDDVDEFKAFERQCAYTKEGRLGEGGHMGEYYFHQSLKSHRWRVKEPEDAILFVVPVYLGAALDGQCGGEAEGRQLILDATTALAGQSWFQRFSGNDHVFVATHWRVFWWFRDAGVDKALDVWNKLIWGRFLAAFEESFCPLILPYSTLPSFDKYHEEDLIRVRSSSVEKYIEERPFTFFFMGRVYFEHHAGGYTTRRAMFDQLRDFRGPNAIITTLAPEELAIPHCSLNKTLLTHCVTEHSDRLYTDLALKSRFHLVVRGDDWSSSRLFDAIYSASLIVAISDGLLDKALPFPCQVDWNSLIIRIPEREFRRNATQAIERYVPSWDTAEGRADLARRLRILHDIVDDVSWSTKTSRVAENVLLNAARRCLPEAVLLRHDHHTHSGDDNQMVPLKSLTQLPCPFTDFSKGLYKPGRHGMGVLQEGWNQDD